MKKLIIVIIVLLLTACLTREDVVNMLKNECPNCVVEPTPISTSGRYLIYMADTISKRCDIIQVDTDGDRIVQPISYCP